jgi:hypothetical protein
VTVECGQVGQTKTVDHAYEFIDAALNLSEIPQHPIQKQDIDLFHTIAIVKIPEQTSFSFTNKDSQILFNENIDHMNFREIEVNTLLGTTKDSDSYHLQAWSNEGIDIAEELFDFSENKIRTKKSVMPAMLTLNEKVIRQDCLCYLMERYPV